LETESEQILDPHPEFLSIKMNKIVAPVLQFLQPKVNKLLPTGDNLEHNNETNTIALTAKKSGIWAGLITLNFCRVNWGVY
jgi:vancomycin permeability regulator SanA